MTLSDQLFKFARRNRWSHDRLIIELAAFIEDRGLGGQLQIDLDARVEADDDVRKELAAEEARAEIREMLAREALDDDDDADVIDARDLPDHTDPPN